MEYCTGFERVCPVCKREYIATPEWVYKRKESYFCSWGCLRKYEKTHGVTIHGRGGNRKPISDEQKRTVANRVKGGETCREIAVEMDVSIAAIQKIQKKMKEEQKL